MKEQSLIEDNGGRQEGWEHGNGRSALVRFLRPHPLPTDELFPESQPSLSRWAEPFTPSAPHYVLSERETEVPTAGSGKEEPKANAISQKIRNKLELVKPGGQQEEAGHPLTAQQAGRLLDL